MKIAIAQIRSTAGALVENIQRHQYFIQQAIVHQIRLIVFPELSLTGYEPTLARDLAVDPFDPLLALLQSISDQFKITICVGMPTCQWNGVAISMLIFGPGQKRLVYSKQHLHADEVHYFVAGNESLLLEVDKLKIAPAICYESLLPEHAQQAASRGAQLYLSSVAKADNGIIKAMTHFPEMAKAYGMSVVMANGVGPSDNFICAGQSAAWNSSGTLLGQLDRMEEGLMIVDTATDEILKICVELN